MDEIFHRVLREELPELGAKLGCQGLVVGQHQCGAVDLGNHIGHGEGLAAAGHTQQGLGLIAVQDALGQCFDGLRLVACWLIGRYKFKLIHSIILSARGQGRAFSAGNLR